jgi:hypothetical protein
MGRKPTAGVACDEHGYIVIEDQLCTNVSATCQTIVLSRSPD